MHKIIWIAKRFLSDLIKNRKFFLILFMVGVGVLLYAILLEHLDLMVLFGPTIPGPDHCTVFVLLFGETDMVL